MLKAGDQLPHFDVMASSGQRVRYATIWQHKHVVLVVLPDDDAGSADGYIMNLSSRSNDFAACETACIISREAPPGIGSGVVIADRWGEVVHAGSASRVDELPGPDALLEWIDYIRMKCPECEGETR